VFLPALNAAAQPLRFLDYLIEEAQPAAIVAGDGILVNVPHPARFAFHKLIVARERPVAQQAKAAKDLLQAGQLLQVLLEDRPGDLVLAWETLCGRGRGWLQRARASMARLEPALIDGLRQVGAYTG
jgi:hypothetical protein